MPAAVNRQWQRARSHDQKQQRINSLLGAAEYLFDRNRYDDVSIAAIAERAGFTRTNTYKYFRSKEEIFLELLKFDFQKWAREVQDTFRSDDRYSTSDFATIWTGLLLKHFRLVRLFSVLHTRIERNLSLEKLIELKRFTLKVTAELVSLITSIYPELSPADAQNFFSMQMVSATGLFQMTDLTPAQKIALDNEEFAGNRIDFGETCRKSAKYLLEGLLSERSRR